MPEILVYVAVCNPSAKFYFGITSASFERRVSRHLSSSRQSSPNYRFHKAIRKYGPDSFVWHKLTTVPTWEEACEIEKFLIRTFDTTNNEFGYNSTAGGEGSWGTTHSRQKARVNSKKWYRLNHLSPCSSITGPKG